jgi:hypothetical protein
MLRECLCRQRGNKVTSSDAASISDRPRIVAKGLDEAVEEDFPVAVERSRRAFGSELGDAGASCFADGVVVRQNLGSVEFCECSDICFNDLKIEFY